jgi:hypothetical protein
MALGGTLVALCGGEVEVSPPTHPAAAARADPEAALGLWGPAVLPPGTTPPTPVIALALTQAFVRGRCTLRALVDTHTAPGRVAAAETLVIARGGAGLTPQLAVQEAAAGAPAPYATHVAIGTGARMATGGKRHLKRRRLDRG